jgi:hypothetical protein
MLKEQDAGLPYKPTSSVVRVPATPPATRLKNATVRWLLSLLQAPAPPAVIETHTEETATTDADWPSLDEVYDEVKDSIASQNDRLKSIDTKANFGLAAATLLTAGVTGLGKALSDPSASAKAGVKHDLWLFCARGDTLADWVTIASLVVYVLAATCAFAAYRLRTFNEVPNPDRLVKHYIYQDANQTKAAIANARAKAYASNEKTIDRKAFWTSASMVLLILEAVCLLLIAFIQVKWL